MLVCCSLCTLASSFAAKPLLQTDIIFCGVVLNSGIFKLNPFWSLLPIEHLWTGKINHSLILKFFSQLRFVSYCCFLKLSLNCLSPRKDFKRFFVDVNSLVPPSSFGKNVKNSFAIFVCAKVFKSHKSQVAWL